MRTSGTEFSTDGLIQLLSEDHPPIHAGPIPSCNRQVSIIFIKGIEQFLFQAQVTLKLICKNSSRAERRLWLRHWGPIDPKELTLVMLSKQKFPKMGAKFHVEENVKVNTALAFLKVHTCYKRDIHYSWYYNKNETRTIIYERLKLWFFMRARTTLDISKLCSLHL